MAQMIHEELWAFTGKSTCGFLWVEGNMPAQIFISICGITTSLFYCFSALHFL